MIPMLRKSLKGPIEYVDQHQRNLFSLLRRWKVYMGKWQSWHCRRCWRGHSIFHHCKSISAKLFTQMIETLSNVKLRRVKLAQKYDNGHDYCRKGNKKPTQEGGLSLSSILALCLRLCSILIVIWTKIGQAWGLFYGLFAVIIVNGWSLNKSYVSRDDYHKIITSVAAPSRSLQIDSKHKNFFQSFKTHELVVIASRIIETHCRPKNRLPVGLDYLLLRWLYHVVIVSTETWMALVKLKSN